jgi:hypothetical protein
MNKKDLLAVHSTILSRIKPEFRFGAKLKNNERDLVFIEIFSNRYYGARAELIFGKTFSQMLFKGISNKERQKISDDLSKSLEDGKPVDTSRWVKPDRESIIAACVGHLMMSEILKEDETEFFVHKAKSEVLFSVLEAHAPKNPQGLTNFGIAPFFFSVFGLTGMKKRLKERWDITRNHGKKYDLQTARKMYKDYCKKCLSKMIVKGK